MGQIAQITFAAKKNEIKGNSEDLYLRPDLRTYRPFSYSAKEPGWIESYFYTLLYTRFDRVALELLSLLCTFEIST